MSQPSLDIHGKKKSRTFTSRLLKLAFLAGIKLDKIDPARKGFVDYQEPHQFPRQEVPTDLDVQVDSGEDISVERKKSELSDPRFPFKSGERPQSFRR
ncbi:MAG: hypothetical protein KBC69_00935 [Candidatus Magasanikbacteria bacterium]|nr:hypothetical protein [Candidatus Magasanikbacteria bacterium]